MSEIKVFKMINGEEIISKVTSGSESGYFLEDPAVIMLQPTQNGAMGVGIAPYMPYISGKVYLNMTAIAAEGEPEEKMKNEYRRIFSGIEIAPASALVGL